jgi:hypothetical protein
MRSAFAFHPFRKTALPLDWELAIHEGAKAEVDSSKQTSRKSKGKQPQHGNIRPSFPIHPAMPMTTSNSTTG